MKKSLSRVLAFVFALALLLTPVTASTASAASMVTASNSSLTLQLDLDGIRQFAYRPDYLRVAKGSSITLVDTTTSTGQWYVPAGKKLTFECILGNLCNFSYYVFENDQIAYSGTSQAQHFDYTTWSVPYDVNVKVVVVANSDNVSIDTYYGVWN